MHLPWLFRCSRHSYIPIVLLESIVLIQYFNPASLFFSFFLLPLVIYYRVNQEDVVIQTKERLLGAMYGLLASSFLWNIVEILFGNNVKNFPILLICLYYTQQFYYSLLVVTDLRLHIEASKIKVNQCNLFFIILFSLVTAHWMISRAMWYNWIVLFYTFSLAIEASISTSTSQFFRDEEFEREEHLQYIGNLHIYDKSFL